MSSRTPLFPQGYTHWLGSRLPGALDERLATCETCAMVKPTGLTRDPGPFLNDLKCCTYFPYIPNFGVGALVKNQGEVGRLRLTSAAAQGPLLPLGLFASPEREALIQEAGQKEFGRRRDLLCPFFDTAANGCSVWANRPGVCATYFCKSERGEAGLEFWADVETYLNRFEWAVANECLYRIGFTDDDMEKCERVMLTDEPGEERDWLVANAWAEWNDRRLELFQKTAEIALEITPVELNEILGDDYLELEESLRARS